MSLSSAAESVTTSWWRTAVEVLTRHDEGGGLRAAGPLLPDAAAMYLVR
jgi:hypothetical protein